jgi:UDP-N-acetylglucosamine 3-dehydrogenase
MIKAAVIGTGNMGKNHVRNYSEIEVTQLVAIADKNQETGNQFAEQFSVNYYEDYKELIEKEAPDLVSICVPTAYHFEIAKYCLEKGINILLEKPITMVLEDANILMEISKKSSSKFYVGHIERFNPAVTKTKELIKNGDLGEITAVTTKRVGGFPPQIQDANIAVDLAIHDIDIVNYLLDQYPKSVEVHKEKNHIQKRADSVEFFLKYERTSAYIQANWISPVKIRKLTITGTEGYLEMDFIKQEIEFYKSNYEKFKTADNDFQDDIIKFSDPDKITYNVAKKEPLREEILHLVDCIQNDKKTDCQFAVEALKIALVKDEIRPHKEIESVVTEENKKLIK